MWERIKKLFRRNHKCRYNDPICLSKHRLFGCICGKGGSSSTTTVYQPQPTPAPSTSEAINAWVQSLPQVYGAQLAYAPQEAAQQVALAQQYAEPYGQAMLAAQKAMYPQATALQEQLAGQASQGMQSQMPDWMKQQYQSDMNARLGSNVGSPIGADYASRGMMQQQQEWQNYYRNLGLSVAGMQPVTQAQQPGYTNYMSNYTPTSNMNFMNQGYTAYQQAARPMALTQSSSWDPLSLGVLGKWG